MHHRAALEMSRRYQAAPDARNGYLGILTVNIVAEQDQEIALMREIARAYPGDPGVVEVPAGMMHGMEMASAGGQAGH